MSTRLERFEFYPASYDLFFIDTLYRQGTLHVFRSTKWQSISDSLIYPSHARKIKCLAMFATEYSVYYSLVFYACVQNIWNPLYIHNVGI